MGLFQKLLGSEKAIESYQDFWTWFQKHESGFFKAVKAHEKIEERFFNKMAPKLSQIREGIFYLTGMIDDNTVELILTADGTIKDFVFVEELIAAAPAIKGWKFTAHKPALDAKDVSINMGNFQFNGDNLFFIPNEDPSYPDDIDITIVHSDWTKETHDDINRGAYIFLDNYLGEINFATSIDTLEVTGPTSDQERVPIHKLKDYLIWREKEFIEKYEGVRHNTDNDHYTGLEAQLENGERLIAIINKDLLDWDRKASHPWIMNIELKYGDTGMPDDESYAALQSIEDELNAALPDAEGYLNFGRCTAEGVRTIHYACKEFRKSSKAADEIVRKYSDQFDISYDLYKDKYWKTFDQYGS